MIQGDLRGIGCSLSPGKDPFRRRILCWKVRSLAEFRAIGNDVLAPKSW
jgi:hypothetical protein